MRVEFDFFDFWLDSVAQVHRVFVYFLTKGRLEESGSSSATGSKVYTAEFRRAKLLQLGRQMVFEILHGGRIHRRVRTERLWRLSL